jgi:predicted DCC family thiol-disulfide oxidoreductase YuxK
MESILLFDGECVHCSKAASAVRELSISGLEVQLIYSPQVIELLESAGLEIPKEPSILVIDGDEKRILNGWRMRQHLASIIGRRRSRVIATARYRIAGAHREGSRRTLAHTSAYHRVVGRRRSRYSRISCGFRNSLSVHRGI